MESPFSTLLFVVVGFLIFVHALLVESQSEDASTNKQSPLIPSPPPPPSAPPPSPPPPSPPPPSPPPLSPPPPPPPPPPQSPLPPSPRNPLQRGHGSTNVMNSGNGPDISPPPRDNSTKRRSNPRRKYVPPPLPPKTKINAGKKIGLMFAGIAAILQIGVVGFLAFKRRQLLKVNYDS